MCPLCLSITCPWISTTFRIHLIKQAKNNIYSLLYPLTFFFNYFPTAVLQCKMTEMLTLVPLSCFGRSKLTLDVFNITGSAYEIEFFVRNKIDKISKAVGHGIKS